MNGEAAGTLAHRVLLPAISGLDVSDVMPLIRQGCRSVLLGETREEYLARRMSDVRVAEETREHVAAAVGQVAAATEGRILVAADHEQPGIRRFAHLLREDAPVTADAVRRASAEDGAALGAMGVNMTLGPILDVVRGPNPWLSDRYVGAEAATVSALGTAAIEGLQSSGVVAVAKHFPGHSAVALDPAEEGEARLAATLDELESVDEGPFSAAVASGVRGLMLGPVPVVALDGTASASLSPVVVSRARDRLGFQGALVTDDIDAPATRGNLDVPAAAVQALLAGADLLLVAAPNAAACADAIHRAADEGHLAYERLAEAAGRVDDLASAAIQLGE